jgi:polar amino acid transport system substrate-binding protein
MKNGVCVLRIILLALLLSVLGMAKEYKLVFSQSTPPYVFKDGSGIVQTIVKEALAYKGHTVSPVFVNIGRGFELFKYDYVDGSTIIQKSSGLKAFYSVDYMQYHNAVFALKKNHYHIQKLSDLKDYHLIGFQNANKYLGQNFGNVVMSMGKKYTELADQKQQVYMLFKGRTNIVAMDRHIFKFYRNELIREGKINPQDQFDLFELFEPTKYQTAFKDQQSCNDFNEGIKYLKKTGRYDAIYGEYSEKYFEVKK